ncbi:MAG: carbohydrate kinase [Clostridiales bacterium]|jgi:fructokinase|nr:carbohydrate kinase [Clostridiales bacterium]
MMFDYDYLSIGEILIDMTPSSASDGEKCFVPNVGGAPANAACAVSVFGRKAGFIGRTGSDMFGSQIRTVLKSKGVDTSLLQTDEHRNTTLAFVDLDEHGDRDFSFYRKGLADVSLELKPELYSAVERTRMLHFGSVSLSEDPSRSTVLSLVDHAKTKGVLISYDPNLRFPLWNDSDYLKRTVLNTVGLADILKLSEDEADYLFGDIFEGDGSDISVILRVIQDTYDIPIVIITQGKKGASLCYKSRVFSSSAYDVKTIDTTGAGDCFMGAVSYCLLQLEKGIDNLTEDEITYILQFANAAGSLSTTKSGAIPSIPTVDEVLHCMNTVPLTK